MFVMKTFLILNHYFFSDSPRRASALILSLLLMSFLIVLGLGISSVVIDSVRIERNVIEAGKAYFGAEAGVERALFYEESNVPGYEIEETFTLSNGAQATVQLHAIGLQVPCEWRPDPLWRDLELQESVSWPLFRYEEGEAAVMVQHFDLSYFVDRGGDYGAVNGNVLRWKILGIDQDHGNTESISGILDYDASVSPNHLIATEDTANFYDGISGSTFVNYSQYPIDEFLKNHRFNYLILTNIVSPSLQDISVQTAESNRLKVQISTEDENELTEDQTACEYAFIQSQGVVGGAFQSLEAQIQLDSALPVYDFVLYQVK
ncbi:MAG: hypothetical protein UW70_C0030G0017 [Candidatus Peregrinibacteria bacterium GW2011_GWA2_44_7]|nr:MAG: hypothetical protein UW70_C0030G0017 [Candidatus Peregrinibacteria bacterium GW2011_GWA2_44_7]